MKFLSSIETSSRGYKISSSFCHFTQSKFRVCVFCVDFNYPIVTVYIKTSKNQKLCNIVMFSAKQCSPHYNYTVILKELTNFPFLRLAASRPQEFYGKTAKQAKWAARL